MTVPTTNELATAQYSLALLASRDHPRHDPRHSSGFADIATLVGQYLWIEQEIQREEANAPYGPGVEGGIHTLHRGGEAADIDARTHDRHVKDLKAAQRDMLHELGMFADRNSQRLEKLVGQQGVRVAQ